MPEPYAEPALRHFDGAEHLVSGGHRDGGGYLIGLAVECAIKFKIATTRPNAGAPHVHLPKLVEHAKKAIQGRQKHALFTVLDKAGFMSGWTINVRYGEDGTVSAEQYRQWHSDANRAIAAAGLRRQRR